MKALTTITLTALLLLSSMALMAQDDENYEINWFLLMNYTGRTGELPPGFGDGGDWTIGETRVRMDVTAWSDSIEAEARVKLDFYHDAVFDEVDVDFREGYIDYTYEDLDFRLGRQVITWGVGHLIFINDVWSKDWESYFSGRPMEYLKSGVDGARIRYSGDVFNLEFVFLPTFEPDTMPGSNRFSYFDPFVMITNRETVEPERSFENSEIGLRLYTQLAGFDVSGYFYKGYWHEPALGMDNPMMPSKLTYWYPELNVYGASAQGAGLGGILSFEVGYYDSREDEDGLNPMIKNSEMRFLVGYSKTLMEDFNLGLQYFRKNFLDYDNYLATLPMGMPASEDYRDEITISLRRQLMQQKLTLALFAYYSPVDEDYYLIPSMTYKLSDDLSVTAGGNFFGGDKPTTFLGQFDDNDNMYLSVRYDF
jgi:hypothetical protein